MTSLFDEPIPERKEAVTKLEELEGAKTGLMEALAALREEQKRLVSEIRAIEKQQRQHLSRVEEFIAEEPLNHEDVSRWVASVHWQFARTMPGNPHSYAHSRWCDRAMFERVVRYLRANGYEQYYGGAPYTVYDVNATFIWTMGSPLEETILINRKPFSLKP